MKKGGEGDQRTRRKAASDSGEGRGEPAVPARWADLRFGAESAALFAGSPDGDQDRTARQFLGMQPVSVMLEDGATYSRAA